MSTGLRLLVVAGQFIGAKATGCEAADQGNAIALDTSGVVVAGSFDDREDLQAVVWRQ